MQLRCNYFDVSGDVAIRLTRSLYGGVIRGLANVNTKVIKYDAINLVFSSLISL